MKSYLIETISRGKAIDFDDTNVVELQDKNKIINKRFRVCKKETFNQLMNGDTTTDDSSGGWRKWRCN